MRFIIKKRNMKDTKEILNWHYEGIYSFYNNDVERGKVYSLISLVNSENAFFIYDENNELVGNCEFYNYDGKICVGLQMKPEMTGKGLGTEFVKAIVEFGKQRYNIDELNLFVAKFNKRAIRVYEKVGFKINGQIVLKIRGKDYDFFSMRLVF